MRPEPVKSPNIDNLRWVHLHLQAEDFRAVVAAASPEVVVPAQKDGWQRFRWERALESKVIVYIAQWQMSLRSRPSEIEQWATQLAGYARSTLYALSTNFNVDGPPTIPLDAVRALRDGSNSEQAVAQSRWLAPPDGLPDRRRFGQGSFLPTFLELGVSLRAKDKNADKHVIPVPGSEGAEAVAVLDIFERAAAGVAMLALAAESTAQYAAQLKLDGDYMENKRKARSITNFFVECNTIYENVFGKKPGGTRRGLKISGPCIRFYRELFARICRRMPADFSLLHPELMEELRPTNSAILMRIQRAEAIRKTRIRE